MALALAPVDGDDLHRLRKTSQHDAARSRSWHLAVCDGGDTGQDLAAGRELGDASGVVHNQSIEIWDAREAHNLAEGSAVKIRYHPKFPDESYRWLGPATDATEDPESKSPDSDAT